MIYESMVNLEIDRKKLGRLPGVCPKCKKILKIKVENRKAVCYCPDRTCGYRYEDA